MAQAGALMKQAYPLWLKIWDIILVLWMLVIAYSACLSFDRLVDTYFYLGETRDAVVGR